jgi:O-antigen/teichoic acid export membrane protein
MSLVTKLRNKIGKEIKAGFWYTVGNFLLKGVSFITIPIYTRILSTSDYGYVSLYTTWVGIFSCIVGLSLGSSVINGKYDFEKKYDEYLSSVLFLSILSFLFIGSVVLAFQDLASSLIGLPANIILIILIESYFSFVIAFNNSKYVVFYQYKKSLFISIGSTILNISLSLALIYLLKDDKYIGRIYGSSIATLAFGLPLLIFILYKGKKFINLKYWKYSLALALPMIPHLLAHLILGQSDRVVINKYLGSSAVGIYSFAYNIGMIPQILVGTLNNAWVPWFYDKMDSNQHLEIRKASNYYTFFFGGLIVALVFITPELVSLLGPKTYRGAVLLIPIIIISYYFQFLYTLLVNVQFYLKKNIFIPIGTVIAGVLNLILNIYFVPRYGYIAATYSTLASYIVLFILHYIITNKIFKNPVYNFKIFIKPTAFVILFTMLFYLLNDFIIMRYLTLAAILLFLFYKYRDKISGFLK